MVSGLLINRTSHSVVLSEAADITEKRTCLLWRRCGGLSIRSLLNINAGAGCLHWLSLPQQLSWFQTQPDNNVFVRWRVKLVIPAWFSFSVTSFSQQLMTSQSHAFKDDTFKRCFILNQCWSLRASYPSCWLVLEKKKQTVTPVAPWTSGFSRTLQPTVCITEFVSSQTLSQWLVTLLGAICKHLGSSSKHAFKFEKITTLKQK